MGVPGPTVRIEWVAFQSGDYDAMAQIQAFGSCGWSGVGKSARLLTDNWHDTIRNGPSRTMTKLHVRIQHALADNED